MFRRGGRLWARKDVPKELRVIIGQTSLQQTLGTGDLNHARVIFHDEGVDRALPPAAQCEAARRWFVENLQPDQRRWLKP
jgi:hypothetical protein